MTTSFLPLAFFQNIGMPEMIVIGVIALLLFGRRLPEVGRSLGRGIVEFKKGLRDIDDEVNQAGASDQTGAGPGKPDPEKPRMSDNTPAAGG